MPSRRICGARACRARGAPTLRNFAGRVFEAGASSGKLSCGRFLPRANRCERVANKCRNAADSAPIAFEPVNSRWSTREGSLMSSSGAPARISQRATISRRASWRHSQRADSAVSGGKMFVWEVFL